MNRYIRGAAIAALVLLVSSVACAQTAESPQTLLGRLTGTWVMEGTIAGKQITHDVEAAWVLDQNYVRLHEVSREKDATGKPEYEAIVLLEWEPDSGEYACLWLDSTGGGGLSANVIGHAKPSGNEIPFLFKGGDGSRIHNTFAYNEADDTWQWLIDNEREGQLLPFARVTLRRK